MLFLLLGNETQKPGGISCDNGVCRDIFPHYASGPHNGVLTNRDLGQNSRARPDGGSLLYQCLFDLPVRFGLQVAIRGCRTGIKVIDKRHRMTNKNVVFNVYALANECEGVDIEDNVLNVYALANECVA